MKQAKYTNKAQKGLVRMPRLQGKKMFQALNEIANGKTYGKDISKLKGVDGFRLRRGEYRAIYQETDEGIIVLLVKPRGDVYK